MKYAECCEQGKSVERTPDGSGWHIWVGHAHAGGNISTSFSRSHVVRFCPFCGHDLSKPVYQSLEQAIASLLTGPPLTICFDVDGVLCDNSGPWDPTKSRPYADRAPYPWVAETLRKLRAYGHRIHIQTARYMARFDGDQQRASEYGGQELRWWLREHDIPYDGAWMGKCSADVYVDDRGCRVDSNGGITNWCRSFVPTVAATQKKKA